MTSIKTWLHKLGDKQVLTRRQTITNLATAVFWLKCLSPTWYMFVTELVYGCHRVGICLSPSWYMFVTDLVYGCRRVSICLAWYIVITDLVYVFVTD